MHNVYWADLHNHNGVGYGHGSLERSYAIAENLLDVYAFTPHGWWPDAPSDAPALVARHHAAFERVRAAMSGVIAKANAAYVPGAFVTFPAYEWHSNGWGDYHLIFPDDRCEFFRASNLDELQHFARRNSAILLPHHVAYRHGWRGLDWASLVPSVSPCVEVFSEHGSSFDPDDPETMLGHSMGGTVRSQCVREQLRKGMHFGLTAGTDDHDGHPASYGEGITGILAESLTREAVFDAIRRRHVFAATGDRIQVALRSGNAIMGDVLSPGAARSFDIGVIPLAPVEIVTLWKNGAVAAQWPGGGTPEDVRGRDWLFRIEWGWGALGVTAVTEWRLHLQVTDGKVDEVIPCLSGGPASHELMNLVTEASDANVRIESFTSRRNPIPISGVVVRMQGDAQTRLSLAVESTTEGERGGGFITAALGNLLADDAWLSVHPQLTAPKARIGRPYSVDSLAFRATWSDPEPTRRDSYLIEVRQRNGQRAWSSPILFAEG
jgi:hypothetical protein